MDLETEDKGIEGNGPDLTGIVIEGADGKRIEVTPPATPPAKPEGDEQKPAEGPALPEGISSVEELIAKFNEMNVKPTGEESDEPGEQPNAENKGEGDDDVEDERDQRIKALEIQLHDNELLKTVGGQEQYDAIRDWAAQNMPEDELDFINDVFDSSDLSAKKLAIKALQALHRDNAGFEGQTVSGGAATVTDAFKSDADLHQAMADPRYYRNDSVGEAYRAEVAQKASGLLGRGTNNGWY